MLFLKDWPTKPIAARGLQRRIAAYDQAEHRRQIARHRNGELKLLSLHQLAVGDLIAAGGNHASFNGELIDRYAELLRG
jgi:hypothetical protein